MPRRKIASLFGPRLLAFLGIIRLAILPKLFPGISRALRMHQTIRSSPLKVVSRLRAGILNELSELRSVPTVCQAATPARISPGRSFWEIR
jgi:hypothetical protein